MEFGADLGGDKEGWGGNGLGGIGGTGGGPGNANYFTISRNVTTPEQTRLFTAFGCNAEGDGIEWGTKANKLVLGGRSWKGPQMDPLTSQLINAAIPKATRKEMREPDACICLWAQQLHLMYACIVVCLWGPYFIATWERKVH